MNSNKHIVNITSDLGGYIHDVTHVHNSEASELVVPDLLIPDGYVQMVFIIEGGYTWRKLSKSSAPVNLTESFISGIQDSTIMSHQTKNIKSVEIRFDPMIFYLYFGSKCVEIINTQITLTEFADAEILLLGKRLAQVKSNSEIQHCIEDFFLNYKPKANKTSSWNIAADFLKAIRNSKTKMDTGERAKMHSMNDDEFQQNFKEFLGFSIDEMTSIIDEKSTSINPDSINPDSTNLNPGISSTQLLDDIFRDDNSESSK